MVTSEEGNAKKKLLCGMILGTVIPFILWFNFTGDITQSLIIAAIFPVSVIGILVLLIFHGKVTPILHI